MEIREVVTKPSQVINAVVTGLRKHSQREDFEIDMSTYGSKRDLGNSPICYGCAATSCLQQLAGRDLTAEFFIERDFWGEMGDSKGSPLGLDWEEVNNFESVINNFRLGSFGSLFWYFNIILSSSKISCLEDNYKFSLETYNWREQLTIVQKLVYELQLQGL